MPEITSDTPVQIVNKIVPISEILDHFVDTHPNFSLPPELALLSYRWFISPDFKNVMFEVGIIPKVPTSPPTP